MSVLDRHKDELFTLVNEWTSTQFRTKEVMNGRFNVGENLVQRIIDADEKDFKIIIKLPAEKYQDWANKGHKPETEFLQQLKEIEGVAEVEAETYTLEVVNLMSTTQDGRTRVPKASNGCMAGSLPQPE